MKIDDTVTRDPIIIADALADHFMDASSIQRYSKTFLDRHPFAATAIENFVVPPDQGQNFNAPFSMRELLFALQKTRGNSAGHDDFGYPMLKNLSIFGKRYHLENINREWANGTIPE